MNSPEKSDDIQEPTPQRLKRDQETAENAGLTVAELTKLRQKLLEAREAIERKVSTHIDLAVPTETHLADDMDQAARDQEMGFSLLLAGKEHNLNMEIEAALKRIENGTYGLCEGTDEPIGYRRLDARPWTRYSVGYQEQLEREERSRGAR